MNKALIFVLLAVAAYGQATGYPGYTLQLVNADTVAHTAAVDNYDEYNHVHTVAAGQVIALQVPLPPNGSDYYYPNLNLDSGEVMTAENNVRPGDVLCITFSGSGITVGLVRQPDWMAHILAVLLVFLTLAALKFAYDYANK